MVPILDGSQQINILFIIYLLNLFLMLICSSAGVHREQTLSKEVNSGFDGPGSVNKGRPLGYCDKAWRDSFFLFI